MACEKMTEKEERLLKTIELQNILIESMFNIIEHYQKNFEPKVLNIVKLIKKRRNKDNG